MTQTSISELWRYRELFYFFAWRDIKVRYRQASLGVAWALIQPLCNMVIFTLLFGRLAHMPSDGIPYPIFCYCALVPWTYFSGVLALGSNSLINNESLITKVYFPRVLLPAGTALAGLLDFVVGFLILVALMAYYHVHPTWSLLFLPFVILMMFLLTTAISMLTAAVNVQYRDIKYVIPFLIQIWMFATPVIYPVTMIPERLRPLLALNPCWGMVASFRACIFPNAPIDLPLFAISVGIAIALFLGSAYYFRSAERKFADVI